MRTPNISQTLTDLRKQLVAEIEEIDRILGRSSDNHPVPKTNSSGVREPLTKAMLTALASFDKDFTAKDLAEQIDAKNPGCEASGRISTITSQLISWKKAGQHGIAIRTAGKPGQPTVFYIKKD